MRKISAAAAAFAALALAACGSDNHTKASNAATGASQTAVPTSGTLRFLATVDKSPTSDFTGQVKLGIDAALSEINAAGGIDGKALKIDICQSDATPDGAATCGRRAAADKSVIASVGGFTFAGKGLVPELEKGGLASVGDFAIDPIGLESKVSFPIGSVQNGFLNAANLPVALLKAKTVDAVVLDAPAGHSAAQQIEQVLKGGRATLKRTVFIAATSGDLSAQLQTLRGDKPDAIVMILTDQLAAKVIQGYRQIDPKTPLVTTGSAFSNEFIGKLGGNTANLYIGLQFARDSAGEKTFDASVAKLGGAKIATDISRNSYVAVKLLADALKRAKAPTRAALLAALHKTDAFDTSGMTPTLDYVATRKLFPRAALRAGLFGKVENGSVTQLTKRFVPTLPDSAPGQ